MKFLFILTIFVLALAQEGEIHVLPIDDEFVVAAAQFATEQVQKPISCNSADLKLKEIRHAEAGDLPADYFIYFIITADGCEQGVPFLATVFRSVDGTQEFKWSWELAQSPHLWNGSVSGQNGTQNTTIIILIVCLVLVVIAFGSFILFKKNKPEEEPLMKPTEGMI